MRLNVKKQEENSLVMWVDQNKICFSFLCKSPAETARKEMIAGSMARLLFGKRKTIPN